MQTETDRTPPAATLTAQSSPETTPEPAEQTRPTATGWAVAAAAFLLCVATIPEFSTGGWPAKAATLLVLGAAGLPFLVWRALGLRGGRRSTSELWSARAAVGLVAVASLSTAFAVTPGLAVVGLYGQGTGLLFLVALTGCWAIGTVLSGDDRRILGTAIIAGAVVNAIVALLQVTVGLGAIGLPLFSGTSADGLQDNPVYLAAIVLGGLVLVGFRFRDRPSQLRLATLALGAGLGASGERLPALLLLVFVACELVRGRRERRFDASSPAWGRAVGFAIISIGGLIAGSLTAYVRTSTGVVTVAANSTANETFFERFSVWNAALRAVAHHPLIGAGPGQFRTATSAFFSVAFVRAKGGPVAVTDGHNIVLEIAVTTGVLGLLLLVAWLGLSLPTRRGPLLWLAGILFVIQLVEPLNVSVTAVMALALGAAALAPALGPAPVTEERTGRGGATNRWLRVLAVVCATVAMIAGIALIVGDGALNRSVSEYLVAQDVSSLSDATTANNLLRPWPDAPVQLGTIHTFLSIARRDRGQKNVAVHWAKVAVSRDPTNWVLWTNLASVRAYAGQLDEASSSAKRALLFFPAYVPALQLLGDIASNEHDASAAHRWFGRALAVDPSSTALRDLYEGKCPPGARTGVSNPLLPHCSL